MVADPDVRLQLQLGELLERMLRAFAVEPKVSRSEALSVGAVSRARDLIAGTLATLPIDMIGPGKRRIDWPLFEQPDPDVPTNVVLAYTYEDLLFEGIAWWRVLEVDSRGFPMRAEYVPVSSVHVGGSAALPSQNRVTPDQPAVPPGGQVFIDGRPVSDREVIRFDSPNPPLLVKAARAIRILMKIDAAVAMYTEEPLPLGYFRKGPGTESMSDSQIQKIVDDWEEARRRRAWGYAGGLEPVPLAWNPEQLQLGDMTDKAVVELARHAGLDPEDLGVSTTSRTYANIEQRRQDLLTFTLGHYAVAVQSRLSMRDVAPRGHVARINFGGFLRTDTLGRYQAYEIGQRVGAITEDETRELEDRPPLTPAEKARRDALRGITPAAVPAPSGNGGRSNMSSDNVVPIGTRQDRQVQFEASDVVRVSFESNDLTENFSVDRERRIITGLIVPWGQVARSGFSRWKFAPDSLRWSDTSRIKLNLHHDFTQLIGRATRLQSGSRGLTGTFKVAETPEGDRALALAADRIMDGFSIEAEFNDDFGDNWQPDPSDESVRLVRQATLRGTALTGMPAFDDARVTAVKASKDGGTPMSDKDKRDGGSGSGAQTKTVDFDLDGHIEQFTKAMLDTQEKAIEQLTQTVSDSLKAGVEAALENIHNPQQDGPQPVRAARFRVTREAPIYTLNGSGPSLVRDAWHAQMSHDEEAMHRIRKFRAQTEDVAQIVQQRLHLGLINPQLLFATGSTSNLSEVIPPGYRPDLFVPQLARGRPFVNAISRGTIANATPFVVPVFNSATGATADHVEGTNPTDGTLDMGTKTVTPGAISGLLKLTREIVDSSNPAIDQIALNAMRESYAQQTEAKVYQLFNGSDGQGGTITNGFVPSGAQVKAVTDSLSGSKGGAVLLDAVREQLALYSFNRFADPDIALLSKEATVAFATAKDTTGRPLLPSIGAENSTGLGNAVARGWSVDGLPNVPAWAITGNGPGDADWFGINSLDAWAWESPLLTFRYEERSGPAVIDLALFGYFACHILRPVGLTAVRLTLTP